MIAEILIVTDQSEVLVRKIYRQEAKSYNAGRIFCKKLKEINRGHIPPHFMEDGVHVFYIQRGSLYFVATCVSEVPLIAVIEFLSRVYHMVKDFCGTVTEDSMRVNILLVFEVLCEAMDAGYVQIASAEKLRPFIQSKPVVLGRPQPAQEDIASRMFGIESHVVPALATDRPAVGSAGDPKELYVDVVENMTVVTNFKGEVDRLKVEGTMNVKNLLQCHARLRIAVNEDLQICRPGEVRAYGRSAQLDGCTFHQLVDLKEFEERRILSICPPAGQFSAMTYSVDSKSITLPVQIWISMEDIKGSRDVTVVIRVHLNNIPEDSRAVKIHIVLPVPATVSSVSQHVKGPSESLDFKDKKVSWTIRRLHNGEESVAQLRLISHGAHSITKKDIGPAMAEFEIANLTMSGLKLRYVKVYEGNQSCICKRFIRYITVSDSYTVKTS